MQDYLPHLGTPRDLEAFFVWRLCLPEMQARKSTDVTQILRWLMQTAKVKNLHQLGNRLEEQLSNRDGGVDGDYLKQYWNDLTSRGTLRRKKMTVAKVISIIKAAYNAGVLHDDATVGCMLKDLDREEILGCLASRWRSLKYSEPSTPNDWERVWKLARTEANILWQHREEWHKNLVLAAINGRHRQDAPRSSGAEEEVLRSEEVILKILNNASQQKGSRSIRIGEKVTAAETGVILVVSQK